MLLDETSSKLMNKTTAFLFEKIQTNFLVRHKSIVIMEIRLLNFFHSKLFYSLIALNMLI